MWFGVRGKKAGTDRRKGELDEYAHSAVWGEKRLFEFCCRKRSQPVRLGLLLVQ